MKALRTHLDYWQVGFKNVTKIKRACGWARNNKHYFIYYENGEYSCVFTDYAEELYEATT